MRYVLAGCMVVQGIAALIYSFSGEWEAAIFYLLLFALTSNIDKNSSLSKHRKNMRWEE